MRQFFVFSVLPLMMYFLLIACDDSSGGEKPAISPELSTVVASPVHYDKQRGVFVTQVTVTAVNVKEQTVAGVLISLESNSENATIDENEKLTDAEGKAVFEVISHHIEGVELTAYEIKNSQSETPTRIALAQPLLVDFKAILTVELISDPIYTAQHGTFSLRLHLVDDVGDVAQAELVYQEMDNGLTITPVELVTNNQGIAEFTAITSLGTTYHLEFNLYGIEEFLSADVDLLGPVISGTITVGMSFPEFTHPRVGIFGLNVFDDPPAIFGELPGSVPIDMNAQEPSFTIHLPIVPPEEWLREVNGGVSAGYFPPALYNDDNENSMWDPEEFIIATHGTPGALVFLYLPTDPNSPHGGWRFFEKLGSTQPMPWDDAANAQNMLVTAAPVRKPTLHGTVQTELSITRVAFHVVDGPLFVQMVEEGQNPQTLLFDPEHTARLLDLPVTTAGMFEGEAADPREVLDATTLAAWNVSTPVANGFVLQQIPIVAFTYIDFNENGSLDEDSDAIATTLAPPFGVTWFLSYFTDFPRIGGFFSPDKLGLHAGWNWIASPKEYDITQVIVNMPGYPTLVLNENIPEGLSDIDFEVLDAATGDVKALGTFASGTFDNAIDITECTDCHTIQVGDSLRVIEVLTETTPIDWSESLTLGAIYGP